MKCFGLETGLATTGDSTGDILMCISFFGLVILLISGIVSTCHYYCCSKKRENYGNGGGGNPIYNGKYSKKIYD